ncbi:exodeoxyribonuclease VII large subunit [Halomonas sp. AOP22-C1-8]|uniref:exodeoxyribonuclease VII large subunit n=1 Tax=Halomonas TaxID=2745 RepID=UPI0015556510|nr:exodeoxyribonuclease VII large subunit [Halomonas hibernica]
MNAPTPTALSVSQLNQRAKQTLERDVGEVWVEGELSNVSRPASGHIYFTLKDDRAQVRCALFRQRARFVSAPMRDGDQVKLRGRVSLFEPRGDYQLIAEAVQAAGLGELLAAFERLKAQLDAEGVFANTRPLPFPPRKILILSSATGAAIRDVLAVLAARWPLADVTLIPVPVQGVEAAPAMIAALGLLNRQARLDPERDVVLITRGGGSLEDLWAFNNEHLARAIFHSRLPVMSAVGHEVDVTLADFAADVRAPTPSAAAERLVPDQHALKRQLVDQQHRLHRAMQRRLERDSQQLDSLRARLRHPGEQLNRQRQHVATLAQRLNRAMQQTLTQQQASVTQLGKRLASQDMARLHRAESERVGQLHRRMENAMQRQLQRQQARLTSAARELNAISPLAVLGRGYAIAQDEKGQVVRRAEETKPGQKLSLRLGEGRLSVEVKRRFK